MSLARNLSALPDVQVVENFPLARLARFACGGPARMLVDCATEAALSSAVTILKESEQPHLLLAGGTNLIIADEGYDGTVLRFTGTSLRCNTSSAEAIIEAESGALLQSVVNASLARGWSGIHCMTGVPGWLGAAIYGNAGAYGQSLSDVVAWVRYWEDGVVQQLNGEACQFRYRASGFKQHKQRIILSAGLRLQPGDTSAMRAKADEILQTRNAKFPPTMKCAGSVFKNQIVAQLPAAVQAELPASIIKGGKAPTAWFLEQVGARGYSVGGIRMADYHANLIYNAGHGTAQQILSMIDELQRRVMDRFGFPLETEVQFVGFADRTSY
jgi:UDP-N-acetylmuramate dehydrogenase